MQRHEGFQGSFDSILDEFDDGAFNLFLPYSNLNRWIPKNSTFDKATEVFPVSRLREIKTLSFLAYVGPEPEENYFIGFSHTREDHVLVVAMVASEIARLNNIPPRDIETLEVAGVLHDIAMPALGDATKYIDPDNLDEERFWQETVDENGEVFFAQHQLSRELIDGVIKNGGILGQVLDIADRVTYTMKDIYNVIGYVDNRINIHPYLAELRYPLSHYPQIGNIYKDVVIDQKKDLVFFTDPEKLGVFLLLRALMHRHLYMDPTSQGRDLFVANLIKPLYSTDGSRPLSPRLLRQMTDQQLLDSLARYYQFPRHQGSWLYNQMTNWYAKHEVCLNFEEANRKAKEIQGNGFLVLGIKECKGFDAGLSYKTLDSNQEVVPFAQADPIMARQITEVEEKTRGIYVFYTDASEDTPINELLRKVYETPK